METVVEGEEQITIAPAGPSRAPQQCVLMAQLLEQLVAGGARQRRRLSPDKRLDLGDDVEQLDGVLAGERRNKKARALANRADHEALLQQTMQRRAYWCPAR